MEDERIPDERPPWEPKSRLEIEREIASLQSTHKRLGESLGWAVDVLLRDETEVKDLARLQKSKREAVEAISYVRDVLTGNLTEIEEERLFGEDEIAKRKQAAMDRLKPLTGSSLHIPQPAAPPPVPVVDPRPKVVATAASFSPPKSITSSASAPSPASTKSAFSPTSPSASLAPWHYTRSSFGSATPGLPSAALPRIPPPTSAAVRRPPEVTRENPRPTPAPRAQSKTEHDPLGVL